MFSRQHKPFQLFTIALLIAMFLPRVFPEGMFADALTYTSIARNMAIGRGTFWQPYFSSSFWIPFEGKTFEFYGHPPFVMGSMAVFFKVLGEHWFVEKAYCIVIWALNVWGVYSLWRLLSKEKNLWWLALLAWYMMPVPLWCYPWAMLDNTMVVFTFAAAWLILRGLTQSKKPYFEMVLAGLCLHLAFLSKGPTGVYPLAIPFIFAYFYKNELSYSKVFEYIFVATATFIGTFALWFLYQPAANYLSHYFNTQLVSSIAENSQTEDWTWYEYVEVIPSILQQGVAPLAIAVMMFIFAKIKGVSFIFEAETTKRAKFYLTIALAGTLPMMVSHKMDTFYVLPALPFFAMAFTSFVEPTMRDWVGRFTMSPIKTMVVNRGMIVLILGVFAYSFYTFGTIGRDDEMLNDLKILRGQIPNDDLKIGVTSSAMKDFMVHTYFERYYKWELTYLNDAPPYFLLDNQMLSNVDTMPQLKQYRAIDLPKLQRFRLFVKKY